MKKQNEKINSYTLDSSEKENAINFRRKLFENERKFVYLGTGFSVISITIIILKLFFFFPEHPEPKNFLELMLLHFDVTGILIGIIGIIVGFLIFFVVENNSELKSIQVSGHIKELQDINEKIKRVGEEIRKNILDLTEVGNLEQRLKKIKEIVDHAHTENNLYILSYDPVYGQFQMSNLEILLREKGTEISKLENICAEEFYNEYIKKLYDLKESYKDSLISYVDNKKGNLNLAFLKNDWIDESEPTFFNNFIKEHIITDKSEIVFVDLKDGESDKIFKPVNDGKADLENTYILVKDERDTNEKLSGNMSDSDKKDFLIKMLIDEDKHFLRHISRNNDFKSFDNIPFQFFLSVPSDDSIDNCYCFIIFTNYYNIAQKNAVVSFASRNKNLTLGLRDMYIGLKENQEKNDAQAKPVRSLLSIKAEFSKIKFVMASFDEHQSIPESAPTVDLKVQDYLRKFLMSNNLKLSMHTEFVNKDKLERFLDTENPDEYSYISLGLYRNLLSAKIGDESGKLFRLEQDSEKKWIFVARSENDFKQYVNFGPGSSGDYAIFCKQRLNPGKWAIVFGGMHSLGTSAASKCITEQNCKLISDLLAPGEDEFIIVFKITKDDKNNLDKDMIFFSATNETGRIRNILDKDN